MEFLLENKKLLRKNGAEFYEVDPNVVLENVHLVCLYFSADWCTTSQLLTPIIAESYKALKAANEPFEVIYVSSDNSEEEMKNFMIDEHPNWLVISCTDHSGVSELETLYEVSGSPTLIFINKLTMKVVCELRPRENLSHHFMRALNLLEIS